jgi:hypothetical protein
MYTLKSIARRGTTLGMAFALLAATVVPSLPVYADALNPLTDRSLTLSSSAPGWDNTDGSGNATYAPPNSGANGQKTGNTFSFKVSSDTNTGSRKVEAMTFQYCTTPAGGCLAPGDNGWSGGTRTDNSPTTIAAQTSDLEIVAASPTQAAFATYVDDTDSNGTVTQVPAPATAGGNYLVYYRTSDGGTPNDASDDDWAESAGWTMTVSPNQSGTEAASTSTGTNNQINLVNSTGEGFDADTLVKVVFFGTNTNYITNPGSGAFFVRINMYDDEALRAESNVIDGGVTVANVMNQSIQITTKVLETMDFSVGTVDPYTLEALADAGGGEDETSQLYVANGNVKHGVCDRVLGSMDEDDPINEKNRLMLGNELGEFSLETARTYSTHSYWRLSSNSSAGATVYYSGVTLSNTVGDKIDAIGGTAQAPQVGSEQFGLALANETTGVRAVNYNVERKLAFGAGNAQGGLLENGDDNTANGISSGIGVGTAASTSGIDASVTDDAISNIDANLSWHSPQLAPLAPEANYGGGAGVVNNNYNSTSDPISTSFAFDESSNTIPVALASQNSQVVDCVTGKVRYVANIAATTPAGIYTTKVNYIASPQY